MAIADPYARLEREVREALDEAADPSLWDPAFDVEIREDVDGVRTDDRDLNHLAATGLALSMGLPVIGWAPALRNPGEDERVDRAGRQFAMAATQLVRDFVAGRLPQTEFLSGLTAAYLRQARNAFLAGKRALGNLEGITGDDELAIGRTLAAVGLDPRVPTTRASLGGMVALLAQAALASTPEGARASAALEGALGSYTARLLDGMARRGYRRASEVRDALLADTLRRARTGDTQAQASLEQLGNVVDAGATGEAALRASRERERAEREFAKWREADRKARVRLAIEIARYQERVGNKVALELSKLRRMLLAGRIDPGMAAARLMELLRTEGQRMYARARRLAGVTAPLTADELADANDEEDDQAAGFLDQFPELAYHGSMAALLASIVLDPTNLIDPDVAKWVNQRLNGVGDELNALKNAGERAAFRTGAAARQVQAVARPAATAISAVVQAEPLPERVDHVAPPLTQVTVVWWALDPGAKHCEDCVRLSDMSPYYLEQLDMIGLGPGSGHTTCGGRCRCTLQFDTAAVVCGDALAGNVDIVESAAGSVRVMEAAACSNPIPVGSLASSVTRAADAAELPPSQAGDEAFSWDADVATKIVPSQPSLTVPDQLKHLQTAPKGGEPYLRAPGKSGAGLVLVQHFELPGSGSRFSAVIQDYPGASRFVAGTTTLGDHLLESEYTVASIRWAADRAAARGLRLEFDERLVNDGLRRFLDDLGAAPAGPVIPLPDVIRHGPPKVVEALPSWPEQPLPLPDWSGPHPSLPEPAWPFDNLVKDMESGDLQDGWEWVTPTAIAGGNSKTTRHLLKDPSGQEWVWKSEWVSAEIAGSRVTRTVGLEAPPVGRIRFGDEWGAIMPFVPGRSLAHPKSPPLAALTREQHRDLLGHSLLDYTIGNIDGHAGNYILAPDGSVWAIDKAFALFDVPADQSLHDLVYVDRVSGTGGVTAGGTTLADLLRYDYAPGPIAYERTTPVLALTSLRPADVAEALSWFDNVSEDAYKAALGAEAHPNAIAEALRRKRDLRAEVEDLFRRAVSDHQAEPWLPAEWTEWLDVNPTFAVPERTLLEPVPLVKLPSKAELLDPKASGVLTKVSPADIRASLAGATDAEREAAEQLYKSVVILWKADPTVVPQDWYLWQLYGASFKAETLATPPSSVYHSVAPSPWKWTGAKALPAKPYETITPFPGDSFKVDVAPVTGSKARVWMTHAQIVKDMEAWYPGATFGDLAQIPLEHARAIAEQIDDLFSRFGMLPSFKGVRLRAKSDMPKGALAEVKRLDKNVPGSAVLLRKDIFTDPERITKTATGSWSTPTWNTAALTKGDEVAWTKDILTHEMGHEWMGLNLYSRFGKDRYEPLRQELDPWFRSDFLKRYKTDGVSSYGKKNEHEAWAELFAAAVGPVRMDHPDVIKLRSILDKHMPQGGPAIATPGEVQIVGSSLPLNAPLKDWSGIVPDEPALPPTALTDAAKKELRTKADDAWLTWEDVKSGDTKYAIAWGPADTKAAKDAGLLVEKLADGRYYVTTSEMRMDALVNHLLEAGEDVTGSDEFWTDWLGFSRERLDAIDAYESAKVGRKSLRAGVVVVEDDGRVWFIAPRNRFAGYENTWSKGGLDVGETPAQAAVREAREEMGLSVELDSYLGDFVSTDGGSVSRFYVAHRTGGGPAFAKYKETYAIRLGTPEQVRPVMLRYGKPDTRDTAILDAYLEHAGLPPVVPITPESLARQMAAESNARLMTIIDNSTQDFLDVPRKIGYQVEDAEAIAGLYAPSGPDGKWVINLPEGQVSARVSVGAELSDVIIPGGQWKSPEYRKALAGVVLGSARNTPKGNSLLIRLTQTQNDVLEPAFSAIGVQKVAGEYFLEPQAVVQLAKALGDPSVAASYSIIGMSPEDAAALASKLTPGDPLAQLATPTAPPGSFTTSQVAPAPTKLSSAFGYEKSLYEQLDGKVQLAFENPMHAYEVRKMMYDLPLGGTQAFTFLRVKSSVTSTGQLYNQLGVLGAWHTAESAKQSALILRTIRDVAEQTLSNAKAGGLRLQTNLGVDAMPQLTGILHAIGADTGISGTWSIDKPALAKLVKALDEDLVPPLDAAHIPTGALDPAAAAHVPSPALAHSATPVAPTPSVTTAGSTPMSAQYGFDAQGLAELVHAGVPTPVLMGGTAHTTTWAFQNGDAVRIYWDVTKTGNFRINALAPWLGMPDPAHVAAAVAAQMAQFSLISKTPILGFAQHLAARIEGDAWTKQLPQEARDLLSAYGAVKSKDGTAWIIGKSKLNALSSDLAKDMGAAGSTPASTLIAPAKNVNGIKHALGIDTAVWDAGPPSETVLGSGVVIHSQTWPPTGATVAMSWKPVPAGYEALVIQPFNATDDQIMQALVRSVYELHKRGTPGISGYAGLRIALDTIPDGIRQDFLDLAKQAGATEYTGTRSHLIMNKASLDKLVTQLDNDEWMVKGPGATAAVPPPSVSPTPPPPPPPPPTMPAVAAQPSPAGTAMPTTTFAWPDYDAVEVAGWSELATQTVKNHPSLSGANTTMKVSSYGPPLLARGKVEWRRLGNGLEVWGISGNLMSNPLGGLVSHLRSMSAFMDANPKVIRLTFREPDEVPDGLKALLSWHNHGGNPNSFSAADIKAVVKALDEDYAATKSVQLNWIPPQAAVPASAVPAAIVPPPDAFGVLPGWDASKAASIVPTGEVTSQPVYLAAGTNKTVKTTTYASGEFVNWRRLGPRLEVHGMSSDIEPTVFMAHMRRMAEQLDASGSLVELNFLFPNQLSASITTVLKDFGAIEKGGRLRMTPAQVKSLRDAIQAEALSPAGAAFKVAAPEWSAVGKAVGIGYDPLLIGANGSMLSEDTFFPVILEQTTNKSLKLATYQNGTVSWRRLGNRVEIWSAKLPDDAAGASTFFGHLRRIAEMHEQNPKMLGLVIKDVHTLPSSVATLLQDYATPDLSIAGQVRMTPDQLKAFKALVDSDYALVHGLPPTAGTPLPTAATIPVAAKPAPPPVIAATPLNAAGLPEEAGKTIVSAGAPTIGVPMNQMGELQIKFTVPVNIANGMAMATEVMPWGPGSALVGHSWSGPEGNLMSMLGLKWFVGPSSIAMPQGTAMFLPLSVVAPAAKLNVGIGGLSSDFADYIAKHYPPADPLLQGVIGPGPFGKTGVWVDQAGAKALLHDLEVEVAAPPGAAIQAITAKPVKPPVLADAAGDFLKTMGQFTPPKAASGNTLLWPATKLKLHTKGQIRAKYYSYDGAAYGAGGTNGLVQFTAMTGQGYNNLPTDEKIAVWMASVGKVGQIALDEGKSFKIYKSSFGGYGYYGSAPPQVFIDLLTAIGVPATSGYGYGTWTLDASQTATLVRALKHNQWPAGMLPPPPSIAAAIPTPTAAIPPAPAYVAPYVPPTPPAPAKPLVDPNAPIPTIQAPSGPVWTQGGTSISAATMATGPQIPPASSISAQFKYDHAEVKAMVALGASDAPLGQVTKAKIAQTAFDAGFILPGGGKVDAIYAQSPSRKTTAFTELRTSGTVTAAQKEAGFWAALQKFADEVATRATDSGQIVSDSKLYVTADILANRPEVRQLLMDLGGEEFLVRPASGQGGAFFDAYGAGVRLNREQAGELAKRILTDTADPSLQGQVLAAIPPPPTWKAVPKGIVATNPYGYFGVKPDDLYQAGTEVISAKKLRAVSTWVDGAVEAEWVKHGSILRWADLRVTGKATVTQVNAATMRTLDSLLEDIAATPGMALDVNEAVWRTSPDLRDVLLKWGGREVPTSDGLMIRLNAQSADELRIDMDNELGAFGPAGTSLQPVVPPTIWPSPQDLSPMPAPTAKGQTTKHFLKDKAGNEWLFKPAKTGRGTHADVAVQALAQRLGLRVPNVREYELVINGETMRGSLQKLVPNVHFTPSVASLTPAQTDELMQHTVLDWLVANDDSHIENFLVDGDGHLWAIDKTRSWTSLGTAQDTLDPLKHGQGGPGLPPLVNLFWRDVRKDPALLAQIDPRGIGRTLRYLEALPEDEFVRIIAPVVNDAATGQYRQYRTADAMREAMVRRKRAVKTDLEALFKREIETAQRTNTAAIPPAWERWYSEGAVFKPTLTPVEELSEELAILEQDFGKLGPGSLERAIDPHGSGPGHPGAKDMQDAKDKVSRYVGPGLGGGGGHYGGEKFEAMVTKAARDYITRAHTWALLSVVLDPTKSAASLGLSEATVRELRMAFDRETGTFAFNRGVRDARSPKSWVDQKRTEGLRSVLSFGLTPGDSVFPGTGIMITAKVRADQVFVMSFLAQSWIGTGELELLVRDLKLEQVIRAMPRGNQWFSDAGVSSGSGYYGRGNTGDPSRQAVYDYIHNWKGPLV